MEEGLSTREKHSTVTRAQAVEVIHYAQQLESRERFEDVVRSELERLEITDDTLESRALVELARACGVEQYVEEARRIIAPTTIEQYEDIRRFGGRIPMRHYDSG